MASISKILNHLVNKNFKLESGKFGFNYCSILAVKPVCHNGEWESDIYEINVEINIDDNVNGVVIVNERRIEIFDLPIKDFMERYLR